MVELNALMKHCIIEANNDFPDLNFEDTIFEAFKVYTTLTEPLRFDSDEEGIDLLERARFFLLDCVLIDMVRNGLIEVDGMDEDGDLVYKLVTNNSGELVDGPIE